jgi:hypothetical protein
MFPREIHKQNYKGKLEKDLSSDYLIFFTETPSFLELVRYGQV